MKHAFIFTVHAFPDFLAEIIGLMQGPEHYFFINVDKKVDEKPFRNALKGLANIFFTEGNDRIEVTHGGFSQIQITINLLKLARRLCHFDYVHFLSGQDYPCRSMKDFENFFENADGRSYMMFDTEDECINWRRYKYAHRTRHYWLKEINFRQPFTIFSKALHKISRKLQGPFWQRPEMPDLWGGWNWFSLHSCVVDYLLNYLDSHPEFLRRFHYTDCCDELCFSTILYPVADQLNIEKRNSLRFIEWHPKRPTKSTPLVLEETEYDDIVKSDCFWCRKVHPITSAKLVEMLKRRVLT